MLTTARIREDRISALRTQDIRKLLKDGAEGAPAPLVPGLEVGASVAKHFEVEVTAHGGRNLAGNAVRFA